MDFWDILLISWVTIHYIFFFVFTVIVVQIAAEKGQRVSMTTKLIFVVFWPWWIWREFLNGSRDPIVQIGALAPIVQLLLFVCTRP